MKRSKLVLIMLALSLSWISTSAAKDDGAIAWFSKLKSGLAAAKKSNRPILLVSAAPHCHNISGIW